MSGAEIALVAVAVAGTATSVAFQQRSAAIQRRALREQSRQEAVQERQFAIEGAQKGNDILREQLAAIAQSNVAAGASGIEPFSGSPAATKAGIRRRAERQLSVNRLNTLVNASGSASRIRQLSLRSRAVQTEANAQSAASLLDTATTIAEIG